MAEKSKLKLTVVTQEKKLLEQEVDSVTAPTSTGEITLLPNHIPILSELQTGELIYRFNHEAVSIIISKGFLNLQPGNELTVIVDSATHERDISVDKAQAAMKAAQETMVRTADERELLLAEASLKRAMWEMKVAEKSRKTKI